MESDLTRNSPPATEVQTEPKQSNFLVILLSILLIISCLIAGFFAYQTQRLVKQLSESRNQNLAVPTPTPTPNPTADWKTYVDPFGYLFSYPDNTELEKLDNKVIVRIDFPRIETKMGICPRYVSFSVADNNSVSKTTEDKYSCIYKSSIINQKIFTESQYSRGLHNLNDQILSTFKFIEPKTSSSPVACTMEAKICPDGSTVGRSGPKCEFAPCPTSKN